ncbi:hypothetical protein CG716_13665 [Mycolicibacterium sphagni]|uniref:Uncharacterized protein n=1 Tax=Mycolicibacterium sphagni TaxID=1786 RepID=A0A255DJT2_9MYCO|nr:hypothetical protein CG716_13665 [Mycolicibacterium sphagni]
MCFSTSPGTKPLELQCDSPLQGIDSTRIRAGRIPTRRAHEVQFVFLSTGLLPWRPDHSAMGTAMRCGNVFLHPRQVNVSLPAKTVCSCLQVLHFTL